MTLLLFLTGLTTVNSTVQPPPFTGLFSVSGGQVSDQFQVTQVSYTPAPMSKRTE
jgi:hypothetical protein